MEALKKYRESVADFVKNIEATNKINDYTKKWRLYRFAKDYGRILQDGLEDGEEKKATYLAYKYLLWSDATKSIRFDQYSRLILNTIDMVEKSMEE